MHPPASPPHDLRSAFRREFASPRLWATRIVVVGAAAAAGLVVVGFTWLAETALALFLGAARLAWWLPLVLSPPLYGALAVLQLPPRPVRPPALAGGQTLPSA